MKLFFLLSMTVTLILSDCGRRQVGDAEPKIIGGNEAPDLHWPWQVKLETYNSEGAASVVGERWILTAAHMVDWKRDALSIIYTPLSKLKIGPRRTSFANIKYDSFDFKTTVGEVFIHPKYEYKQPTGTPINDIALIKLEEPLTFSDAIQPVCLPRVDCVGTSPPHGAIATGYGFEGGISSGSNYLKEVRVPFMNSSKCESVYPFYREHLNLCAGDYHHDACKGDSGGPLVIQSLNGTWFQYGITSYGESCGSVTYPGVYVRISAYCDFIEETTEGEVTCTDPLK